jgi:YfiH family protein
LNPLSDDIDGNTKNKVTGWRKQPIGDLPLYQAKTMAWLPRIVQGFTTRSGGASAAPYDALNLGTHVGDDLIQVQANRQRVYSDLGISESQIVLAEQVHGDKIAVVTAGSGQVPIAGADALVTNTPGLLLMLFFADCAPVYFVDPARKIVGLAHAGWRGTASNIAGKTLQTMVSEFGCVPSACFAAIGPSIGGASYEVGAEVADQFRSLPGARASTVVTPRSEIGGTYNLNLRAVIFGQLLQAGIPAGAIAVCDEDTFHNKRDFFSYRRDGITGRMGAFLGIKGNKAE